MMILPTLEYEQKLWAQGVIHVVGVDEVGRGALAGPVVAAAVIFDVNHQPITGIRDSKTLSKLQKLRLSEKIYQTCLHFSIGEASSQEIDSLGIVPATALAMQRALEKLPKANHILIDGLPFKDPNLLKKYQKTFIVKGDSLSYSIASSSIIAKVHRDTLMHQIADTSPEYHFQNNVGYGTVYHLEELRKRGPSVHHRHSFLSKLSLSKI